ncbi:xanthine dehydrogenase family protein molybdopterin-binding subunit [Kutzneria buriramensis]|uniref:Xanthine dehydrogenase YagR molybdenum-binding subunit n=1 Tax=Kutzneria buriramensis TaxID=1045776 RepID=A0A3E0G6L4_9PSEU|nr:xanthine dehydrogenase family protein molybdopterin-binding subunit [Kutzneria buriramensis]REH17850.1 xanthine dehydrogenase YagR molybdenum-binding subunit [Kutzneria buriramensis]
MTAVGSGRTRLEGHDKVTGAARYAGDVPADGLLHGWPVLATIPRGRITGIDTSAVQAMPGVVAVLHHGNSPRLVEGAGWTDADPNLQLLQDDRIPYAGWPVALVVAETFEQARAAAMALPVKYHAQPWDVTFSAAHPGLYTPDEVNLHQPSETAHGDLDAGLSASAVVLDRTYTTPEEHHNAMEPHAAIAQWVGGRLEVVDSNQGSYAVAQDLAKLFALDLSQVRVRSEHVGGGFGSKATTRPPAVLAAMAATVLCRPVRVVLTRRHMFSLVGYRPPTSQRIRLGAAPDGRLLAYEHLTATQTATTFEYVEPAGVVGKVMYAADALRIGHRVVRLDVPIPKWMRGPGEAPGAFALESAMDELAEKCGIDPIDLRIRNEPAVAPGSGRPFTSRNVVACYLEGAKRFGWYERDPRPGIRREGRWWLGTGMGAATYPGETAPATAAATAEIDGTVTIRITAADIGTGARTALAQIAADALSLPVEWIRMRIADSDFGPAILAGHSFGTASWGLAVDEACKALRARTTGTPTEPITVQVNTAELIQAMGRPERHAFGAQFAEVAVDVLSGEVRVRRLLGVYAIGRVVNPLTARSQLVGGMVWGLSMALHEEAVRDPAFGGHLNANLAGYHYAANADVPDIEVGWVDDPDLANPTGIKGAGEIGIVGVAAAIANAVWHATGIRHRNLPITPARVLATPPEGPRA